MNRDGKSGKSLSKRKTIGLLMDWLGTSYHVNMMEGIADYAGKNDYNLLCFVTGRLDSQLEWEKCRNILFDAVDPGNVDGLIVMAPSIANLVGIDRLKNYLKKYNNLPVVTVGEKIDNYPCLTIDNEKGMSELLEHLIHVHGYKKIAFISGPRGNHEAEARFKAYQKVLGKHHIPLKNDLIIHGDFLISSGKKAVETLLDKRKVKFDVIVSSNDTMALGVLEELKERKINVPEDIPVVGFDDAEISQYLKITTVNQPFYLYGQKTAEVFAKYINGEDIPPVTYISTKLVIRNSCGCFMTRADAAAVAREKPVLPKNYFDYIASRYKESILLDILHNKAIDDKSEKLFIKWVNTLLKTLAEDLNGKSQFSFIQKWNKIIFQAVAENINLTLLGEMLHAMRMHIFSGHPDAKMLNYLNALFKQAEVMLVEAAERSEAFNQALFDYRLEDMNDIGERLITSLKIEDELKVAFNEFPSIGIRSCFLSIYENNKKPLTYSRMLLAYNNEKLLWLDKKGKRFPTKNLIHPEFMPQKTRYSFLVESLFQGYDQIGLVLFSLGAGEAKTYEILRHKLSVALKGAMLIEQIKMQAQTLEEEVKARTADLTLANKNLKGEITERKKIEERLKRVLSQLNRTNSKLHKQSLHDELTGLYNRRGFILLSEQHYKYAIRSKKNFLLVFCDMDKLKLINDNFGHKEGDFAIRKVAGILQKSFRDGDIIGRLGGDEFVILVLDSTLEDKDTFKSRIYENLAKYNASPHKHYQLSLSMGCAYFNYSDPRSFDELLSQADQELYKEKAFKRLAGPIKIKN